MGVGNIQYTVLQTVNEVQRKLDLQVTSSLLSNKLATLMVDYINDVCDDLADFGQWQETVVTSNVTCVSGQTDYQIATSAAIENIKDMFFSQRRGPLRYETLDTFRVLTRVTITGTPTQYTIIGTNSAGNPNIRVRPTPAASEDGGLFSILYYTRSPRYIAQSDANTLIPFPARVVVQGVLAKVALGESQGTPTDKYTNLWNGYMQMRKTALNRYKGDTGWNISFTPGMTNRWRR